MFYCTTSRGILAWIRFTHMARQRKSGAGSGEPAEVLTGVQGGGQSDEGSERYVQRAVLAGAVSHKQRLYVVVQT